MSKRVFNFSPGPAALPVPALEAVRDALLDFAGTGVGILETSHRSKQFDAVLAETKALLRELLSLPADYHIFFMGGGASLQFAMCPMNVLGPDTSADYILTGAWSKKALKEAKRFGKTRVAATTEVEGSFKRIPRQDELDLDPHAAYVHLTSNNTIFSTQWKTFPDTGNVPIVADMSSDILSRRFDASRFGYIYAGAQKNLGPAGVTVGIMSPEFFARCTRDVPTMLAYKTFITDDSLYNTPPVFAIFTVLHTLKWIKDNGGLEAMEAVNEKKGALLYGILDEMSSYYRCPVDKDSRSLMNVAFRLPTEDLEKQFIAEAAKAGFVSLKGHRSVGGVRVSMYNALPLEGIEQLVQFMRAFAAKNG